MLHRFQKLTAWLGIFAIWLSVLVPLASQAHTAALRLDAPICSAESDVHLRLSHGAAQHGLHLDACGYCSLLAHSAAIGSVARAFFCGIAPADFSVAAHAFIRRPFARYTNAYPRAPPIDA